MKRFKKFINEANAMDFLKPKSEEEIKQIVTKEHGADTHEYYRELSEIGIIDYLNVGDFMVEYYNGIKNDITGIYRIAKVNREGYTAIDIQNQGGVDNGFPLSIDDNEIFTSNKFADQIYKFKINSTHCFEPISKEKVESMIIELEKEVAIDIIMETPHGISGVKRGREREHWENTNPYNIANTSARDLNSKNIKGEFIHRKNIKNIPEYVIVKLLYNGKIIYDPYGNFKCWGHRPVNFN